ncbi:hypothetical protein D3C78_1628130 [compost metagenome]
MTLAFLDSGLNYPGPMEFPANEGGIGVVSYESLVFRSCQELIIIVWNIGLLLSDNLPVIAVRHSEEP